MREGPPGRAPRARVRNSRSLPRRAMTAEDFHGRCGWPFSSSGRCIGCGSQEPRRSLRIREADGEIRWVPVHEAVARGGRSW
jgi:hypothetical protein